MPADFGDASDTAPDAVLNRRHADWEHLQRRTLALVFPDWRGHVELAEVVRAFLPGASAV